MKKVIFVFILLVLLFSGQAWADTTVVQPTGNRDGSAWSIYPSGNAWDAINDTTANDDVNYIYTTSTGASITQGWSHTNWTTSNCIDSVRLTMRAASPATAGTRRVIFGRMDSSGGAWNWCTNSGGTDTVSLTSSYANFTTVWTKDPYDNAHWDTTNLNNTSRAWAFGNNSVGTLPDSFGRASGTVKARHSTGYWAGYRFQADFTGTIDSLSVQIQYAFGSENCKLALYSDSGAAHYPYQLIDTTATFLLATGNNRVSLVTGNNSVTNGTYYWIGMRVSVTQDTMLKENGASGVEKYKALTDASAWPATAPTGASSGTASYCLQAIGKYTADNRITQSFTTVYYHDPSASACTVYVVADSSPLQWDKYPNFTANHYSLVDDPAGSPDNSTYIYTNVTAEFDWFVPDSFQINCIADNRIIDSVVVKKRIECYDGTIFDEAGSYSYLKDGSDSANSGSNSLTGCGGSPPGWENSSWSRTTHPNGSGWTKTNLKSTILGIKSSIISGTPTIYCTQLYYIVYHSAPDTSPPDTVTGVDTTAVTTTSVNLKCDKSDSADCGGYMVRYAAGATAPATYNAGTFGDSTSHIDSIYFQVTGLSVNTQYSFSIFARDEVPNWTVKGSGSSKTAYTKASAPAAPTVDSPTTSTLNVTTHKNGNPATTGLAIWIFPAVGGNNYVQADGSINTSAVWQDSSTWATKTVTGLSVNTTYWFKVKARNGDLTETAFSDSTNKATLANVPSAPTVDSPTTSTLNVTTHKNGNPATTGLAIWITPAVGGNNYVQANGSIGASAVWQDSSTWGAKTVTGLSVNTTYYFKVKARNGDLTETAFSDSASGATSQETSPPDTVTGVDTTAVNVYSVDLVCAQNDSADCGGYMVRYAAGATAPSTYDAGTFGDSTSAIDDTTFTVSGLSENTQYSFAIFARDEVPNWTVKGSDSWITITTDQETSPPAQVTGVDTTEVNTYDVLLVCDKNDSVDCAGYEVRYNQGATAPDSVTQGTFGASTSSRDDTTFTVSGLSANTQYSFSIFAKDEVPNWTTKGSGSWITVTTDTSTCPDWWNTSWTYRKIISSNTSHDAYTTNNFLKLTGVNTTGDKFMDNGNDLRIVYWDSASGTHTDLGRYIINPNAANTEVYFKVQANIPADEDIGSQGDYKYYMYYGNSGAGTPPTYVNTECVDAPYSVDANTMALWHLDEASWNGTAGEVKDTAGTNHGTRRNQANTTTTAKFGMAGAFDATDDWVNCGTALSNPGQTFTIEGWCRRTGDGTSSGRNMFSKAYAATAPYASWCLELSATNTMCFSTGATDNSYTNTPQTAAIDVNTWYHIAGTYDGSYKRIYRNGVKGDSLAYTKTIAWNSDTLDIGATHYNLAPNVWPGQVDEIRFSNSVRTNFYHITTEATLSLGTEGDLDASPPDTVTGVDTTAVNVYSVDLVCAQNDSADCAGYMVRYATGATAPATYDAGTFGDSTSAIDDTTFTVTGLSANTQYSFTIFARDEVAECPNWTAKGSGSWITVTTDAISLSITASPTTWDLDTLDASEVKTMTSGEKIKVTNTGNVAEQLSLKIDTMDTRGEWTCSSLANGQDVNKYVMSGVFRHKHNDSTVTSGDFNTGSSDDVIDTLAQWVTGNTFAVGTQDTAGANVAVSDTVALWLQMKMPTTASGPKADSTRNVIIQIGCQQAP